MSNRRYCCYRHHAEGKLAKDVTYCNSHVQLGLITPPSPPRRPNPSPDPALIVLASKPFRIENRTHDYNEIIHKNTLPERLTNPRVYIESMIEKGQRRNPLLTRKNATAESYETTFQYFQRIASALQPQTRRALLSLINQYFLEHGFSIKDRALLIGKPGFVDLLGSLFHFSPEDAGSFWQIAYRDGRFNHRDQEHSVSMQAFTYNFEKYYLSTLDFKNMFSEAALRQRLIDLRLRLHDWKAKNIFMKLFLRGQLADETQLQSSAAGSYELQGKIICEIDERNQSYFLMRTLAKVLYPLTDTKFLSYERVEEALASAIKRLSEEIQISHRAMRDFIENEELYSDDEFEVVRIMEFLKDDGAGEQVMQAMVRWMRGIFKFVYFQKYPRQPVPLGVSFDFSLMQLHCSQILKITPAMAIEYNLHLKRKSDATVHIIQDLLRTIDGSLSSMPHLEGPKKVIVQCNYVAEAIIRYLKSTPLSSFYRMNRMVQHYRQAGDCHNTLNILNDPVSIQEVQHELQKMFSYSPTPEVHEVQRYASDGKLVEALAQYNSLSGQTQAITLKQRKRKSTAERNQDNGRDQAGRADNSQRSEQDMEIGLEAKGEGEKSEREGINSIQIKNKKHEWWCSTRECCMCVAEDIKESISSVETMESQLFELLQL